MARSQVGEESARRETPAGVIVSAAVASSVTLAWLLVYLAGLPFRWLPVGWVVAVVLATPLLAGAMVSGVGRSWSAGAISGALAGVALLLSTWPFIASGEDHGWGLARGAFLCSALAAVLVPGLLGAIAARGLRASGTRSTRLSRTLESWQPRLEEIAMLACAIALVWRGPRLTGTGGGAAGGGAAAFADRWSGGLLGALVRDGGASLWPAPVSWAFLVASTALAVRVATRRSAWRDRSQGLPVRDAPVTLLPAIVAALLALAWLLAEVVLARPWSGVAGTLCGGALLVALAAGFQYQGARAARSGFARLMVAAIVALLVVQLTLGGAQREQPTWLWVHVLFGVAVLLPVALHFAVRGWLLGGGADRRLPLVVGIGVTLQVALGVGALLTPPASARLDWLLATLHLWVAVALIAAASWLAAPDRARAS